MIKNKKEINLILFIFALAFGIFLGTIFMLKTIRKINKVDYNYYNTAYQEIIINNKNNILKAFINNKYIVVNVEDKVIDENENNGNINILYNDYYTITYDNTTYLKKNGITITTTKEKEYYNLIESNNQYISIYYDNTVNDYHDELKVAYYDKTGEMFMYNSKTGEILIKNAKIIAPVLIGIKLKYFYIEYNSNNILYDIELKETIELGSKKIISDESRLPYQDYKINNSKYIVFEENSKRGLIDLKGNIFIPAMYNDLYFKEDTTNLIAAVNDKEKYGIINDNNLTKVDFIYDGIIIKNNYVILLKDNRIGILDRNLNVINDFLVPYNNNPFVIRETSSTKNSFEYQFKSRNLIISSNVLNDYNTYIIGPYDLINLMLGEKPQIIYSDEISAFYIITETYEEDILTLKIYDASGNYVNSYLKNVAKNIRSVKCDLINKNTIKVNYYDLNNNYLSSEIINLTSGQKIANDNDNKYNKVSKVDDLYYLSIDGYIKLFNKKNKVLDTIPGQELRHIKDNKYIIKKDNKWYLIDINI